MCGRIVNKDTSKYPTRVDVQHARVYHISIILHSHMSPAHPLLQHRHPLAAAENPMVLITVLLTILILISTTLRSSINLHNIHPALAILWLLAPFNMANGSFISVVNHVLISLTCWMLFDILYKTSRMYHQSSNSSNQPLIRNDKDAEHPPQVEDQDVSTTRSIAKQEDVPTDTAWIKGPAFREAEGVFVQKTPSVGSNKGSEGAGATARGTPKKPVKERDVSEYL